MSDPWPSANEERNKPLNPATARLNEVLQTQYLDLDNSDTSCYATVTRVITKFVGSVLTPGQILGVLRVLKAITVAFIILSIVSNIMYIIFVEFLADHKLKQLAGGNRDTILRIYALPLSLLCLVIELDYAKVLKKLVGLKGFVSRGMLYFFVAQLTAAHPNILDKDLLRSSFFQDDDQDDYFGSSVEEIQVPSSAIGFQRVTSFVLCAIVYLICGIMCLDRFTARAFLSNEDPTVTTAIPKTPHESPTKPYNYDDDESSVDPPSVDFVSTSSIDA